MEDNNKKPKRVSKKVIKEEEPIVEAVVEITSEPVVEKSTNDEEYKELYKKRLPHIAWTDYVLTDEEMILINSFDENKMTVESANEVKRLLKLIYDEHITITTNCGSCGKILMKKLIKLKTLSAIQHDYFKA